MRKIIAIIILAVCFIQCETEKDTSFLITNNSIGKLNKESLVRDIEIIFEQDSIVKDTTRLLSGYGAKKIKVFEKGGNHLLTLTPTVDSIPTIENIRIYDERFQTEKGININSTFKEIKEKYSISKILTSFNNVVVILKNTDVYFTIDKKELPSTLRYNVNATIEAVQIPDTAKVKYMMIGWD